MTGCTGRDGAAGTRYTYAQLQGLWIKAGGPKELAPLAAAIAEAESSGCSAAINLTDNGGTQTSWGLWQISNGTHGQPVPNIRDPAVNARAAVGKWRGAGGFSPWGTYDSGAYRAFMRGSTTPDLGVPAAGSAPGSPGGAVVDSAAAGGGPGCLLSVGGQHLGLVFGHGPSLPSTCLITKTEARAVLGAILMASGGLALALGAVIMAAYGLKSTGAGRAAGRSLEATGAAAAVIPGAQPAAAGLRAAGGKVRKAGSGRPAQRRTARRAAPAAPPAGREPSGPAETPPATA